MKDLVKHLILLLPLVVAAAAVAGAWRVAGIAPVIAGVQPLSMVAIHVASLELDSSASINASPTLLGLENDDSEWVNIKLQNPNSTSDDWVGVFSPAKFNASTCPTEVGNSKEQAPFICSSPIKYQFANYSNAEYTNSGNTTLRFQLINQRSDFSFALFRGGLANPKLIAFSNTISFANPKAPLYPRLAQGKLWNELFPNLNKVIFLDDDVVIQRDLSPLWEINMSGKVNGAVETCNGDDKWVMSKRFRTYFNFSHPIISNNLDPEECAWAYGMNIFDLSAWRRTKIRDSYHYWFKENLMSNLTLWKFGTLPPALIAFRGYIHPINPSWHMLGLGYQEKTNIDNVRKAAVIHYNGQCKPWLEIGIKHLKPFWTKHVNYSNEFIRNCHILNSEE